MNRNNRMTYNLIETLFYHCFTNSNTYKNLTYDDLVDLQKVCLEVYEIAKKKEEKMDCPI